MHATEELVCVESALSLCRSGALSAARLPAAYVIHESLCESVIGRRMPLMPIFPGSRARWRGSVKRPATGPVRRRISSAASSQ